MKYLKNLLIALLGRNPYLLELEQTREEYMLTASRVQQLETALCEYGEKQAADKKRIDSLQNLTEILRKRITEKDAELHRQAGSSQEELTRMRDFYDKSINERDEKIAVLREELDDALERLQKANHALAHDCMAQQTLDKTVSVLDDLYNAMQSDDIEGILFISSNLDWCVPLLHVAERHVAVLQMKNELEAKLRLAASRRDDNFNYD